MDWNYIAGFFDGEGCISITTRKATKYVVLTFTQKEPEVLIAIKDFLKNQEIPSRLNRRINSGGNFIHNLIVCNCRHVYTVLIHMQPCLIVKQEKASQALNITAQQIQAREAFSHKVDVAINEYLSGESSLTVGQHHRISHTTLMKHLRQRGIVPRTREESASLGCKKRSAEYVNFLTNRIKTMNSEKSEHTQNKLSGAEVLFSTGTSIRSLAQAYSISYPAMRNYLISIKAHVPTHK